MAANQVFVVVTKSARTASTVSASVMLAARVVANIMPSVAEFADVLAANSNVAVTIYDNMTVWLLGVIFRMVTYSARLAAIFFRCNSIQFDLFYLPRMEYEGSIKVIFSRACFAEIFDILLLEDCTLTNSEFKFAKK
jgi:hypothetical protein